MINSLFTSSFDTAGFKDSIIRFTFFKNKLIKEIIKVFSFMIILSLLSFRIIEILDYKTAADNDLFNFRHFYETPDNLMDVIFLGSSHCYCSINNAILFDEYGIASYDFAIGAQHLGNTFYLMDEAFKTQSPKLVVIETYGVLTDYYGSAGYGPGDVYRNTLGMKYSGNYIENARYTVKMSEGEQGSLTDLVLKWPIVHTRYSQLTSSDYIDSMPFQRGHRDSFNTQAFPIPEAINCTDIGELSDSVIHWINSMITLAKDNGSEIIFYAAPFAELKQEDQMKFNALNSYLSERGIAFINFNINNPAGIDYSKDMWDLSHLNINGSKKVSEYMGLYIKSSFPQVDDRRNDGRYKLWEEDVEYYYQLIEKKSREE